MRNTFTQERRKYRTSPEEKHGILKSYKRKLAKLSRPNAVSSIVLEYLSVDEASGDSRVYLPRDLILIRSHDSTFYAARQHETRDAQRKLCVRDPSLVYNIRKRDHTRGMSRLYPTLTPTGSVEDHRQTLVRSLRAQVLSRHRLKVGWR